MSRTPVAVDCVVWFSLADRAGAVDRSIRLSSALRLAVGWLSLYLGRILRRGILRLVLVRLSATGCVVGGVLLLFVGASPIQSRGHARYLARLLVLSCPWVQPLAAVERSSVAR